MARMAQPGVGIVVIEGLSVDILNGSPQTEKHRMTRCPHPDKDVDAALKHAEAHGWYIRRRGGHAWGRMYCPCNDSECRCGEFCITSIWSTPRNPGHHARALRRVVDNCARHRRAHACRSKE